jgi:hypothetical protein
LSDLPLIKPLFPETALFEFVAVNEVTVAAAKYVIVTTPAPEFVVPTL